MVKEKDTDQEDMANKEDIADKEDIVDKKDMEETMELERNMTSPPTVNFFVTFRSMTQNNGVNTARFEGITFHFVSSGF